MYIVCNVKGIPNSWRIEWIIFGHIRYHISNAITPTPTPQSSLTGPPNYLTMICCLWVHHASLTFGSNTYRFIQWTNGCIWPRQRCLFQAFVYPPSLTCWDLVVQTLEEHEVRQEQNMDRGKYIYRKNSKAASEAAVTFLITFLNCLSLPKFLN